MAFPFAAIVSLAGQAASGIMSALSNKKAQHLADQEAARQQAFYEQQIYQDPLKRSENQQIINKLEDVNQERLNTAKASAKITGATPESVLAVQKQNADATADVMSAMAAGESARRENYVNKLNEAKIQKAEADLARENARQETFGNLASNAANAFGSIVSGYAPKKVDDSITETTATGNNSSGGGIFKTQTLYDAWKNR